MASREDELAETEAGSGPPAASGNDETLPATPSEGGGMRRSSSPAIAPGAKIGRFTVLERLGEGGMGVVVAAYDPELDRKVAIKMLHDQMSDGHGARLEREARAMARLADPNVVTVHDVGRVGDRLYIAMEYVDGQTLRAWLGAASHTQREVLDIVLQAGRGLAAAHRAGFVHRDFKPDNVLVGKDGRVRVSDFGLVAVDTTDAGPAPAPAAPSEPGTAAAPAVLSSAALTQVGAVMGTPLFMAPEQHQGKVADAKADQFAFAVTLWHALSGELPFGTQRDELLGNVLAGRLAPMPRAAHVAPRLRAILARALAADPAARWPSMAALLEAIERTRAGRRWPYVAAAACLAALGGGVVLAAHHRAAPDPCAGGAQHLAGVWDPPRRQALAASFRAAHLPDDSAHAVAAALDRYAAAWVGRYRAVCRATAVLGEQSPALLDQRMQCLDLRLAQVGELVARLDEKAPHAGYTALDALEAVPPLADCDDLARLRAAIPLPADPSARRAVADLDRRLAEAGSYDLFGNSKKAAALLPAIEAEARRVGYTPLIAKAVLLRAGLQAHSGQLDAAVASYRDAADAAARAEDDAAIAQAWADLISVYGAQGKYADALALAPVAHASTERVADQPLLGARYENAIAGIYAAQGAYADAKAAYDRALVLVRKGPPDNKLIGPALANAATGAWYVGDKATAERDFEAARAWFVARYGEQHPMLGYIERDLGDLRAQQDDTAGALPHYERALALFEAADGPDHVDLAIALVPLCYAYAQLGQRDKARAAGERALAIQEQHLGTTNPALVATLQNLAQADLLDGSHAALADAQQRLARAVDIGTAAYGAGSPNLALLLQTGADVSGRLGDAPARRADLERLLAIRTQAIAQPAGDTGMARLYLADVELELARTTDAASDYARAEQRFAATDPDNPERQRARFGHAQVLAASGRRADAIAEARRVRAALGDGKAAPQLAAEIDGFVARLAHAP